MIVFALILSLDFNESSARPPVNMAKEGPVSCNMARVSCGITNDVFAAASCPILRMECSAYRQGNEAAFKAADDELARINDQYAAGGLRTLHQRQPSIGDAGSPPSSIENHPRVYTGPDQRARGYGGFQ
jgi:hypothetical protein